MTMTKRNNNFKHLLATMLVVAGFCPLTAQNVVVDFLSPHHALLRNNGEKNYVLLPVEEAADISHIRVISNTREVKDMNVRLAVDKVDYFVPIDLSELKGQPSVLDIHSGGSERQEGTFRDFCCWKQISYSNTFDSTNREIFRPSYHHSPAWGWMNDPNGMFYFNGEYHLFFQHNPYGSQWENMHWGHAVSRDLVNWQSLGNAISPDAFGTIFSGSCVVDTAGVAGFGKNAIIAIYTSAGESQTQSLAYSTDGGKTFSKYAGNPIITSNIADFRDPHMFWNNTTKKWNMILAAQKEMQIYSSDNLLQWTKESSFGAEYGSHEGVWECPDLIKLPIRGTKEHRWVLICNINPGNPFGGSGIQYFVGNYNGHKFTCQTNPSVTKWLDYGKDNYAAVTFFGAPNGRQTLMGWMSNWQYANQVPTKQYRNANTLPRELDLYRYGNELYVGCKPSPEVMAAKGTAAIDTTFTVTAKRPIEVEMPNDLCKSGAYAIDINLKSVRKTPLNIQLSNSRNEVVTITYDPVKKEVTMDRTASGNVDFSEKFPVKTVAPVHAKSLDRLTLFFDHSSIEMFGGDGLFAMTNLVFPSEFYNKLTFTSSNTAKGIKATICPMKTNQQ